jgi:hypothetical protein
VRFLQPSSGGDPYGLSLVVDTVAGALSRLWRLIVGRGRWRVIATERGTNRVVFAATYGSKREAEQLGLAQVERMFKIEPER